MQRLGECTATAASRSLSRTGRCCCAAAHGTSGKYSLAVADISKLDTSKTYLFALHPHVSTRMRRTHTMVRIAAAHHRASLLTASGTRSWRTRSGAGSSCSPRCSTWPQRERSWASCRSIANCWGRPSRSRRSSTSTSQCLRRSYPLVSALALMRTGAGDCRDAIRHVLTVQKKSVGLCPGGSVLLLLPPRLHV